MDSLPCWNQNLFKERSFYHEFWEEILFNGQKSVDGKKSKLINEEKFQRPWKVFSVWRNTITTKKEPARARPTSLPGSSPTGPSRRGPWERGCSKTRKLQSDTNLAISDNSIFPSLFLSNDSNWNKEKSFETVSKHSHVFFCVMHVHILNMQKDFYFSCNCLMNFPCPVLFSMPW